MPTFSMFTSYPAPVGSLGGRKNVSSVMSGPFESLAKMSQRLEV